MDMFLSVQQQSAGSTVAAQRTIENAGRRENLIQRERTTLREMPELLRIIKGRKPLELNGQKLKELEELARDDYGMVGNISRNILTLHGYHFPPVFALLITKEEIAQKRSSNVEGNTENMGLVFPNPAKDNITIQFPRQAKTEVSFTCEFFNISGTLVKKNEVLSGESQSFNV